MGHARQPAHRVVPSRFAKCTQDTVRRSSPKSTSRSRHLIWKTCANPGGDARHDRLLVEVVQEAVEVCPSCLESLRADQWGVHDVLTDEPYLSLVRADD